MMQYVHLTRSTAQLSLRSFATACRQQQQSVHVVSAVSINSLAPKVRDFISSSAEMCKPARVHICDGSDLENESLLQQLHGAGVVKPLTKYDNCWLARTDPADVARVESKTVVCTDDKRETVPLTGYGVRGQLNKWISPSDMEAAYMDRFPGCMRGRTMYVIPFSMGPVGSPLSKIGIQLTDSPYVVASMRVMTRMGKNVLDTLDTGDFVHGLHSVGVPLPTDSHRGVIKNNWPCNPEKTLVAHIPSMNKIASFGSGYGGNSLLGKKCFALRLGSILAKKEGWLAEHMLILGITNPKGVKKYIAAAFPSQCGKTNLAMMVPSLPGYKVECVGDDIAWMRFDENGRLRAINPEAGFFGVAPGTSMLTNPNAMKTITKNTLFTNVGETSDGGFYWEGLTDKEYNTDASITTWLGEEKWTPDTKRKAAHPNSRFCAPADQCPMMDADWESPRGVPIDAILFGGRRPEGVPLVYEAFNWQHGVFMGASMRSEATAAAEFKGKVVMHDPFAMRPFFGYNFGDYLKHWLSMTQKTDRQMPKIFHVNWFRKDGEGKFIWPGFGENARVLDWVCRRVDNEEIADKTAIGYVPKQGTLNTDGLGPLKMEELLSIPKEFWLKEVEEIDRYFKEQVNEDLPQEVALELNNLRNRLNEMQ